MQKHLLQHGLGGIVPAVQVGVEHLLPLLRLQPDEEIVLADTGIVHQYLYILAGMGLLPAADDRFHSLGVSHIKLEEFTLAFDEGEGFLGRNLVGHIVDEHIVPHLVEFLANGATDAAATAGNKGCLHTLIFGG